MSISVDWPLRARMMSIEISAYQVIVYRCTPSPGATSDVRSHMLDAHYIRMARDTTQQQIEVLHSWLKSYLRRYEIEATVTPLFAVSDYAIRVSYDPELSAVTAAMIQRAIRGASEALGIQVSIH